MQKEKKTPMGWIIRILVVLLFVVALVISANRLMEWNKARAELEALREKQATEASQE